MFQQEALATYRRAQLETATPYELVGRLYGAAIRACKTAAVALESHEKEKAREAFYKAQDILTELMASLDFKAGGEIALDLHQLYEYMHARLVESHLQGDAQGAREVAGLLEQIAEAWAEMKPGRSAEEKADGSPAS